MASRKWSRKDKERLIRVMKLLLEKNSGELRLRGTDESGRTVFDLLPKEYHGEVE